MTILCRLCLVGVCDRSVESMWRGKGHGGQARVVGKQGECMCHVSCVMTGYAEYVRVSGQLYHRVVEESRVRHRCALVRIKKLIL